MSIDNNKHLVRLFLEDVYGIWNINLIDSIFHAEYSIVPHPILPQVESSIEGEKTMAKIFQTAFPDLKLIIKNVVAENDIVCAYWKATGTHTGNWFGVKGSGKKVSFRGSHHFSFYEDKIKKISVVLIV